MSYWFCPDQTVTRTDWGSHADLWMWANNGEFEFQTMWVLRVLRSCTELSWLDWFRLFHVQFEFQMIQNLNFKQCELRCLLVSETAAATIPSICSMHWEISRSQISVSTCICCYVHFVVKLELIKLNNITSTFYCRGLCHNWCLCHVCAHTEGLYSVIHSNVFYFHNCVELEVGLYYGEHSDPIIHTYVPNGYML